ncbi:MAG: hypothetical protein QM831_41955 [Kofleriaceae bacterium]
MKALLLIGLFACGGSQKPAPDPEPKPPTVAKDTRTPYEQRRDAACDALQPKLSQCALADAKATMSPKELADLKPDELMDAHKQKWLKECKGSQMSSRQVRVLEVCNREESECGPLADCLKNLEPEKSK